MGDSPVENSVDDLESEMTEDGESAHFFALQRCQMRFSRCCHCAAIYDLFGFFTKFMFIGLEYIYILKCHYALSTETYL